VNPSVFRLLRSALVLGVVCAALPARAELQEDTTRVALQVGYRYQPNARFAEWAELTGHPLAKQSSGGPSLLGVFAYRPLQDVEVSLEIGWTYETFEFLEGKALVFNQLPITLSVRYTPFTTQYFYPYIGAGFGYFLNFFSDAPGGTPESHGQGPVLIAGGVFDLSKRFSVYVEYRYSLCRVELLDLGYMQVGGNQFFLGIQLNFPPDTKSQQPMR